jgi:hypothetical protein
MGISFSHWNYTVPSIDTLISPRGTSYLLHVPSIILPIPSYIIRNALKSFITLQTSRIWTIPNFIPADQSDYAFWIQLHAILRSSVCYINPSFGMISTFPSSDFYATHHLRYFIPLREVTPLIAILEFLVKAVIMNSIMYEQGTGQHHGTIDEIVTKYHPFVTDGL